MSALGVLIAILIGLAIMAVFAGLLALMARESVADRMYEIVHSDVSDMGGARIDFTTSRKTALKQLDQRFLARGIGKGIADNLVQADVKLTVTEYVLIVVGVTLLGGLAGFAISRHPISALVAGIIAFFVPGMFVSWRRIKRRRDFGKQLADAVTQIAGSLRAGYSLVQSLDTVAKQLAPPAGDEFVRVVREVQLGQTLTVALAHLMERIKSDDLAMIVSAINIHQQVGGNLAGILETVGETIRERVRIKQEISVLTAQQRISGYVLAGLPIALAALLLIINPSYETRLFAPGPTLCIPTASGILMVIGFFIIRNIVDIEV
jgi:tight adherence protein B